MKRIDWLPVLALVYGGASFAHHFHNAVFLHDYPNLPASLSVARVWLAWCATALVGIIGYVLTRGRHEVAGLLLLAVFGALGLLGLAHYHLAPMADHTFTMNATIGCEVVTATVLLVAVVRRLTRHATAPPAAARER